MIEGSKKCNYCEGGFELESSRICEKHTNGVYTKQHKLPWEFIYLIYNHC